MRKPTLSVCGSGLLFLHLQLALNAGALPEWQLTDTALAPVLITGRVLAIYKNGRIPENQLSWKAETWSMTADVEVLRSFTASGMPLRRRRVRLRFLSYGPSVTFINFSPPPLPNITRGDILILPLKENGNPASEPWRLIGDAGIGVVIPARADAPGYSAHSPSSRAFLINEFANTLSGGTPSEIAGVSDYLARQRADLSGDLMPLLEQAIGDDKRRWAAIAAGLHAKMSPPVVTVAELFSAKPAVPGPVGPNWAILPLLLAVLRKLEPSPATDALLIRSWIAEAPFNSWGSANSLVEYADHAVTTETLRQALRADVHGSLFIARVIADHSNHMILPDAIARAFRVVNDPHGVRDELVEVQSAAVLLLNHGSDQDVARLAGIVRKYQARDENYYKVLWQYATASNNLRGIRVLAIVLIDRRIQGGSMRYCDWALAEFDRLTEQEFDIEHASIPERDAAISRALTWIKAH